VGSDVERMTADARARRGTLPVLALSLTRPPHARTVADWVRAQIREYADGGHLHTSVGGVSHHPHEHAHRDVRGRPVCAARGDRHELHELRRGARLAPRILTGGAPVRAAFVPTQAGPLAGDEDRIRIVVRPAPSASC
jgi:hypothetical protein